MYVYLTFVSFMLQSNTQRAQRIGAPLEAPSNTLPLFPTEESWYLNVWTLFPFSFHSSSPLLPVTQVRVGSTLLSERFVEFSRR